MLINCIIFQLKGDGYITVMLFNWKIMASQITDNSTLSSTACWEIIEVLHYWPFIKGIPLRWRHNGHDGISNHQPHECLLNSLFRCRSKKTSKLRVTGLRVGNSPGTGEFPAQMASNAENVSIWWRLHAYVTGAELRQAFWCGDDLVNVHTTVHTRDRLVAGTNINLRIYQGILDIWFKTEDTIHIKHLCYRQMHGVRLDRSYACGRISH